MTERRCSNARIRFELAMLVAMLSFAAAPWIPGNISQGQTTETIRRVSSWEPLESSPQKQLRIRMTWGGGLGQTWTGRIAVSHGNLSEVSPLGITPDSPGTVRMVDGAVVIHHWVVASYGGADLTLKGDSATRVHIELSSIENPEIRFKKDIPLDTLISQTVLSEIDGAGNQFSITRAPADRLEVSFDRDHLVFRPGESFRFSMRPKLTEMATKTAVGRIQVVSTTPKNFGVSRFKAAESVTFQMGDDGSSEPADMNITVPNREGVYNVELEIEPVWYQASFNSRKKTIRRRIQILVLSDDPIRPLQKNAWREISVADLARPDPSGFATWSRFAGRSRSSIGNENRRTIERNGQSMIEIAPGGWQAIPLDIGELGHPHLIEIEYLSEETLAVGLSLLELDSQGQVALHGCDSGLFLPKSLVSDQDSGTIQRHRMTIWPTTKTLYLLVANRHNEQSVTLGKIRVYAGPERLEAAASLRRQAGPTRKMMAFYESTLAAENFGASESQPDTDEPLDDWVRYYRGADRLIQYLKANSYHGAFMTVASDGSSIYPSDALNPSPKHDRGTYFQTGQDPIRKDRLEMLFRMFEREGLSLVPAISLTAPLPLVEATRNQNRRSSCELQDLNQNSQSPSFGSTLPIYNPLDRRVQLAVKQVIDELARRYRSHRSFEGVAIICRPDSYLMLPGLQWGNDLETIQRFYQSQPDLGPVPQDGDERLKVLMRTHRKQWIQWRAAQMSAWYHDLAKTLRASIPQGTLYLAPVDLYQNEDTASALSPSLHGLGDYEKLMLQIGFSKELLRGTQSDEDGRSLVLLRPHRLAPDQSYAGRRIDWGVENSKQAQRFFHDSGYAGDLFTHRMSWAHFAQLQSQEPFQDQSTPLMRLQQMTPGAKFNRRRFAQSIHERDTRLMVDGGSVIAMGQEDSVADMMQVYGQLPDRPFQEVVSPRYGNVSTLPVAVRQDQQENGTFFYCVNSSPWPIRLKLQTTTSQKNGLARFESLSQASFVSIDSESAIGKAADPSPSYRWWTVELPPFELVGGFSPDAKFSIADFQFELPEHAEKDLRKRVYSLQSKLNRSKVVAPLSVIKNPSFELEGIESLPGWEVGASPTGTVSLKRHDASDPTPATGSTSMTLSSDGTGAVWVRSNSFELPDTGRLSISVWLRTADPSRQPPLRLAVEGQSNGINYYRFGSVGSLSSDGKTNQLDSQWKRFAVHFNDLPVGGLDKVRIGFDLMGPGQVAIDHIQIYDRWFDENDAKAITQLLASAGPLLSGQETFDSCRRLLEGYWPGFLDEYFPSEDVAPRESATIPNSSASTDDDQADDPSAFGTTEQRKPPMFRRFRKSPASRKSSRR